MNANETNNGPDTNLTKAENVSVNPDHDAPTLIHYIFVFLIYLAVYLFIFRGIVMAWPDLIAGRSVLNSSELVPFFSPGSQLIEQARGLFSELTHGFEFRVRYSILTTWMRYYLILPFSIIFAPLIGGYLTFVVVYRFLHKLLPDIPRRRIFYGTALSTLFIQLILLPAKIIHFYTLILGFDVFLIALVFLLDGLFFQQKNPTQYIVAASLIVLLSPGVHFLILYPLVVVLLCTSAAILLLFARKKSGGKNPDQPSQYYPIRKPMKRLFTALAATLFLTIIPYAFFIKFFVLRGVPSLIDLVPDTFQSIQSSSSSLLHQLTFDLGSVTDNFLIGQYVTKTPRTGKLFYTLIAILPFFITIPSKPRSQHRLRMLLTLLLGPLFVSIWCGLGYTDAQSGFTFHEMLAALFNKLYLIKSPYAEMMGNLIAESIHVLRFPHRFQFIYLAIVSILLPLGIATLRQCLEPISTTFRHKWKFLTTSAFAVIFFFPLLSHWEDRSALLSGNMGGLIRPYNLQNIREIKETLSPLPRDRMIVLPSSDANWTLQDPEGGSYKFIDKFYIYFLDQPSYYYGSTGDALNKYYFFLLMESLYRNDLGWINILRNLHIRYLVVNKELQWESPRTNVFLKQIGRAITYQPKALPGYFKLLKENESFALYEFTDPQAPNAPEVLFDVDWNTFSCLRQDTALSRQWHMRFPGDIPLTDAAHPLTVVTNNAEKTLLDLYGAAHPHLLVRPDPSSFAFNQDHIPSSQYFNTPASMLNILTMNVYNKLKIFFPGPFDTITSSFVGLPNGTTIRFPISVEESSTYELLLRGITTKNRLSFQLDDGEIFSVPLNTSFSSPTQYVASTSVPFGIHKPVDVAGMATEGFSESIPKVFSPIAPTFYYTPLGILSIPKGKHWLFFTKQDSNPLIVEGIILRPIQKTGALPVVPPSIRLITPAQLQSIKND